jgi:hypothetical protein
MLTSGKKVDGLLALNRVGRRPHFASGQSVPPINFGRVSYDNNTNVLFYFLRESLLFLRRWLVHGSERTVSIIMMMRLGAKWSPFFGI